MKEGKETDKNSDMCFSSRYCILWVSQSSKSRKLCSLWFTIHGLKQEPQTRSYSYRKNFSEISRIFRIFSVCLIIFSSCSIYCLGKKSGENMILLLLQEKSRKATQSLGLGKGDRRNMQRVDRKGMADLRDEIYPGTLGNSQQNNMSTFKTNPGG